MSAAEPSVPDLGRPRRVHVVAAGGAGMSGIAKVLAQLGHSVTGSDLVDSAAVQDLRSIGVPVDIGHRAANVGDAEFVVASTAVAEDNPELVAARELGLAVYRRAAVLSALAHGRKLLSVSGTHGKTTTSSMLAVGLSAAGVEPGYLLGAPVRSLGSAAAAGSSALFVLEADESDASFLAEPRAAALVTNIEADHLEFWGGWDELLGGFDTFLARTDGPRIVCGDDPTAASLGARHGALTYGQGEDSDYVVQALRFDRLSSFFELRHGDAVVPVELGAPGLHNVMNAAGALAVIDAIGQDVAAAAAGLAGFTGAARRFERRGSVGGVDFVDDYAHLPTEVRAALAAGRSGGWSRVIATFQPHRYSRTEALWQDFATAFDDADVVVLTEIYPAGESPRPGVSGALLVDAVRESRPDLDVRWSPTLDDAADLLAAELRDGDVCMSIGAGDVTGLSDAVIERMKR